MELFSLSFGAMGSPCALHLHAPDCQTAERAAEAAVAEIARLEARYSRYRPDSLLTRINRAAAAGEAVVLDEETGGLLDYAFAAWDKSGGLFDITSGLLRQAWDFTEPRLPDPALLARLLPRVGMDKLSWQPPCLGFAVPGMELDLGGVVKEYAADRAAEIGAEAGLEHGLVDLGGDIRVIGPHPDGTPWRIGIRHPGRPGEAMAVADLAAGGLASSGDYERFIEVDGRRYGHILNPATGWPVQGLAAVTVVAETCLVAGSLASIAMLKEADGPTWLAGLGLPYTLMDRAGRQAGTLPSALD